MILAFALDAATTTLLPLLPAWRNTPYTPVQPLRTSLGPPTATEASAQGFGIRLWYVITSTSGRFNTSLVRRGGSSELPLRP